MKRYVIAYIATALVFFPLDAIWLSYVARDFFRSRLGDMLAPEPNLIVAGVFYAVFIIGIVIFAVEPALRSGSWVTALVYGGLFGFFVYATYDMTNIALLRSWPVSVAVVDVAWGTFVNAAAATIGYLVTRAVTAE